VKRERNMQPEFEKEGREAEREGSFSLQAQRRERKMPSEKKRKPHIQIGAPH
jgi:hypothetical protein